MFEARVDIGSGIKGIVKGQKYELDMIYAHQSDLDKSRIELISTSTGFVHTVTAKQLNEFFTELD